MVLDLHLPDDDGSGVVAAFRRDRELARTDLVIYSAADVGQDRRAELELGRTLFLTKGRVGPEELRDRVLELVGAMTERQQGHTRG